MGSSSEQWPCPAGAPLPGKGPGRGGGSGLALDSPSAQPRWGAASGAGGIVLSLSRWGRSRGCMWGQGRVRAQPLGGAPPTERGSLGSQFSKIRASPWVFLAWGGADAGTLILAGQWVLGAAPGVPELALASPLPSHDSHGGLLPPVPAAPGEQVSGDPEPAPTCESRKGGARGLAAPTFGRSGLGFFG